MRLGVSCSLWGGEEHDLFPVFSALLGLRGPRVQGFHSSLHKPYELETLRSLRDFLQPS